MREYIYHIKKEIKARSSESSNYCRTIGSTIKFARLSKGMTLEEACEDISSCSYLSKLENNKIKLTPKFKEKFEKRLDIKLDRDPNIEFEEDLETIINAFIYDNENIDLDFEKYKDIKNHESYLIDLCSATLYKDYEQFHQSYNLLKSYIVNFSDKELGIFLMSIICASIKKGYYSTAYELLSLIPKALYDESTYALLIYKFELKCSYKLNYVLKAEEILSKYSDEIEFLQKHDLVSQKRDDWLLYTAYNMAENKLEETVKRLKLSRSKMVDILQAILYYRKANFDLAKKIIKNNIMNSERWLNLGLIILGSFNNDLIKEVLKSDIEHLITKEETFALVRYLKKKNFDSEKDFMRFIKNELTPKHHITDNFFVLSFILNDLKNIFSSKSLYKDATEATKRLYSLTNNVLSEYH